MKYYLKTFGCQMNEHDSERMEALLRQNGYARAIAPEEADVVVVNTCSVREKSYQKALSEIGRLAGSEKFVAVTGCVASQEGERLLKKFPFVRLALGPDHVGELPRWIREVPSERPVVTAFEGSFDGFPTAVTASGKVTASVTIMKGCDQRCSFCIVPFVRGPEVSRPSASILGEIRKLQERGVREILLLGQNVTSYGKGLPEGMNFARLLRLIDEETSIDRIRFTSPHPKDLSSDLMEEYRINAKLCPQIHLPVQSGSNRILGRMRRAYTREVFLRKVERLRRIVPEIAVTTDLIVGFPGETDDDFEETLSLMKEVRFDGAYSFAFSPRPLTEAFGWADDVPTPLKKERLAAVQELQAAHSLAANRSRIGKIEQVLVEGPSKREERASTSRIGFTPFGLAQRAVSSQRSDGGFGGRSGTSPQLKGRTPHGRVTNFDGDGDLTGGIIDVEIVEASANSLKGRLCSSK